MSQPVTLNLGTFSGVGVGVPFFLGGWYRGYFAVSYLVTGTFNGALQFDHSADGSIWIPAGATTANSLSAQTSFNPGGVAIMGIVHIVSPWIRAEAVTYTSGTGTVYLSGILL